jgi:hypothetical protein
MRLPNAENVIVDLVKVIEYCLSQDHPRGKHKARVFEAACGFTLEHADSFREQLLNIAQTDDAIATRVDAHGRRFMIECQMSGPGGEAIVRTAWIIRSGEDFPRFVSAYVLQ